jgi:hypothetical protein
MGSISVLETLTETIKDGGGNDGGGSWPFVGQYEWSNQKRESTTLIVSVEVFNTEGKENERGSAILWRVP